ncbi:hypothetical protein CH254_22180 [Rhodococcus sp. 06-412-2C]|uniref:glycosyltransferase family 4 protein n=1 Tax=unclassified Rhodococcus (in: high G+C Gram-positive bacteria) TaxID=192944 RepID=UPI000B9C6809|nr:hypothetical protein CH254_22180 [Rhodococcus sp. 06-412-2C]OZC93831.1 hypothetical protein CH279_20260 [Rhodococcus sp. 06-412-2B]
MKIAVVNSFYSSSQPSGENIAVCDQVDALRDSGHDVEVFSRESPADAAGIVYKVRSAFTVAGLSGPNPSVELKKFDPDIVHVHNLFPNWSSGWIGDWSDRLVTTLHNYRSVCSAATLFREKASCTECLDEGSLAAIRHRCYRSSALATLPLAYATRDRGSHFKPATHAQSIITLNQNAQRLFQGIYADTRVECVPNFVNPFKRPPVADRQGWIYAGRLTADKGILELIRNWPRGIQLDIYGSGDLQRVVSDLVSGLAGVSYHGVRPRGEIMSALGAAHGLILPSLWSEGIPTIAIEALAMGTPLVVSERVAAAMELTAAGSGVIFCPTEAKSYAAAIDAVLASRGEMGSSAAELFAARYARNVWLERMNRIYTDIHLNSRH